MRTPTVRACCEATRGSDVKVEQARTRICRRDARLPLGTRR